jgi:PAS domain S-box-containing protein
MVDKPSIPSELGEAVLHSVAEALVVTDPAGVITLINPAAEKLFLTTSGQALGQPLRFLHPLLDRWLERAASDQQATPLQFEFELGDQQSYFVSLARAVDVEGHQPIGWVIALQDVTELKRSERWKSEAIQMAAHDLRNPLNLVAGAANLLRDLLPKLNPEQQECFDMLKVGTESMAALVEQLLKFEQVESGSDLNLAEVILPKLVQQIVDAFKFVASGKGVSLTFESETTDARVLGDESWLQRAVANLVSNAIKYTPSDERVMVRYREAEGQAIVEVTDTGPGIPQTAQARLFERFYRVRGESTQQNPGSGLGLAIVKTIVERHAGQVWVTSQEGVGSTFGFSLPLLKR